MASEAQDKKRLIREIRTVLRQEQVLLRRQPWGAEAGRIIERFSTGGKLWRGSLLIRAHRWYCGDAETAVYPLAAATEIMHAGLLIHDDIMDRDDKRRCRPAIHRELSIMGEAKRLRDCPHFGLSLAICLADLCFFLAQGIIAKISPDTARQKRLARITTEEYSQVILAQMSDVELGATRARVCPAQITRLYLYKTARYTFSLPLMLGALLAGQPDKELKQLGRFGAYLGLVFQLKDDDLGLFGQESQTGKPAGSDIRAGKQTLLRSYLTRQATPRVRARLETIFGNRDASPDDIILVKQLAEKYSARADIKKLMTAYSKKAGAMIPSLAISARYHWAMRRLIQDNLVRRR
ncbi:MAG: Polyprenyl synthetase [Candidatus Magasanikbacteria bacterium GW2011_GWA2_56_11]|uniref:Polyprenyl synthetase n=1 Tax=Candidatus Magasanikbacteria bacterium GW2011_GWA2_56_11 TaxID=1619044 RepID=A0A0G1YIM7_9BACT|nr:MAG: Polyprenyl synthetase [Candidatus Magasanikbacteria bacterium GW2011_GWA2_56_11]